MAADAGGAPRPRERGVPAARQPAGAAHGAAQEARQEVRRTGPDLWGQGGQEGPGPVACDGLEVKSWGTRCETTSSHLEL